MVKKAFAKISVFDIQVYSIWITMLQVKIGDSQAVIFNTK